MNPQDQPQTNPQPAQPSPSFNPSPQPAQPAPVANPQPIVQPDATFIPASPAQPQPTPPTPPISSTQPAIQSEIQPTAPSPVTPAVNPEPIQPNTQPVPSSTMPGQPQQSQPLPPDDPAPVSQPSIQTPSDPIPAQSLSPPLIPVTSTPNTAPQTGSKKLLVITVIVIAAFVAAAAGIFAFVRNKQAPVNSTTSIPEAASNQPVAAPPKVEQSVITVNKILATDLGQTITVLKVIRNFADSDLNTNEEGVLVETRSDSDGTYTVVTGKSVFRLIGNDGQEVRSAYLITDTDMTKAGFTPLPVDAVKKGKPVSGFVPFAVTKGSKKLTLRYHRSETHILGGQTLPPKDFDLVIAQ